MTLKTLESCGGKTRELGDYHNLDLLHTRRRAYWLFLLDVHVSANLLRPKPQADFFYSLAAIICHFQSLRSHLCEKILLVLKIREQSSEQLVELLVSQLVLH